MNKFVISDPATKRISATSDLYPNEPTDVPFNFPEDFDFEKQSDYLIQNGTLVYDPLPIPVPVPTQEEINAANIAYLSMLTGVDL